MSSILYPLDKSIFTEENISKNILPYYDLHNADISMVKFKDTDKQRAVYKISANSKYYSLKKIYFSEEDLLYVYSSIEWLHRNGLYVPNLISSISRNKFVKYNNMLFILTPWIEGIKCNFDNLEHVISSVTELAKIHKCSKHFVPILGSSNREGLDDLQQSTYIHSEQLLETYNLAFKCRDTFSKNYIDIFDKNLELAKLSLQTASKINIDDLSTSLCHGDYVNKNIIISPSKETWIIDFDKCKYDYCSHDLSYFMRRLLKRQKTNWDINITLSILKSYNLYNHLTSSDLRYIIAYICFPQKYWKISRDYYKNINKCNKVAFVNLLNKYNTRVCTHLEFANSITKIMDDLNWQLK
ncbi:CotS family spore coat protein [Clostridium vincentii]|uniref:Spore coat protein I n=1 Tax=Clostridium vincentii TaxID=52704 RepID=A0A2T0BJ59_9CLOT|nr:CotS family spore coat protein [Clostridium vincentii]PRR83910.1 Spore coat protein I [Clostridium vincentii]